MSQSPDIGQNSDGGYSHFRISSKLFINENSHDSRTSHDIDVKVIPVTKRDKKNTATSKNFDDNIMSANCDVIVLFPIYDILKPSRSYIPEAWSIKLAFPSTTTFYSTTTENSSKKPLTQLTYYCFKVLFFQKMLTFCQKLLMSGKLRRSWYLAHLKALCKLDELLKLLSQTSKLRYVE